MENHEIGMMAFWLCVAGWISFVSYNIGAIVGCLKERKRKRKLKGYHDVEEFYPEEKE